MDGSGELCQSPMKEHRHMRSERVIVIGAGIGGLAAALDLAARGAHVTVLERAARPGGKLRQIEVGGRAVDAGPTVFTLRSVFEELFARAGASLSDHLTMTRVTTLARHAWPGGASLDLFADIDRSAAAIGQFGGLREAAGYRRFAADSQRIYRTLEQPFIRSAKPTLPGLIARVAATQPRNLWCIQPYASLWRKLGDYFRDIRLRQLFARYATYNGSSPFSAPATLMLIAHVEREGVWLIDGGMQKLADALAALIERQGGQIRCDAHVAEIMIRNSCAEGVRLASGEVLTADAVVCNADVTAVAEGAFGRMAQAAARPVARSARSLSAMTWAMAATPSGFPLLRHSVFFSTDYRAEFDDILKRQRLPRAPTVYLCAQDRGDVDGPAGDGPERLFCVVNAPATGDSNRFDQGEVRQCFDSMVATLARCGLRIEADPATMTATTPADFHRAFPSTGGAIYGRASHGWMASFQRAASRSKVAGLYFAGGSSHPGAGLPMAALSGMLAATALRADLVSQGRFRPAAMSGGMSTA
jgi:1-hydroxycarotenoid 3,4-desaturase